MVRATNVGVVAVLLTVENPDVPTVTAQQTDYSLAGRAEAVRARSARRAYSAQKFPRRVSARPPRPASAFSKITGGVGAGVWAESAST
jgi:hypothetical protein